LVGFSCVVELENAGLLNYHLKKKKSNIQASDREQALLLIQQPDATYMNLTYSEPQILPDISMKISGETNYTSSCASP